MAAEQKDLYAGNELFVRGQPATITHMDYPHVHWRTLDMPSDSEKHRSFSATPHIFSVDPTKRGTIPHGGTAGVSPSLSSSFKPVPTLRVGSNPDEDDDDEDDDDDDDFSEQAVTAVLKPEQATRALQHLQERRSPKHSPRQKKGGGDGTPPADSDS